MVSANGTRRGYRSGASPHVGVTLAAADLPCPCSTQLAHNSTVCLTRARRLGCNAWAAAAGGALRACGSVRSRRVRCDAVAAPEAPAKQQDGPIIMNGQVLHSITEERLELIRSLGTSGYLEKQVRHASRTAETARASLRAAPVPARACRSQHHMCRLRCRPQSLAARQSPSSRTPASSWGACRA
jgi:hypothetical protein